jgi:hypothetical protein
VATHGREVQRSHHADAREHGGSAAIGDEHERLDHGLPFRQIRFFLWQIGYVRSPRLAASAASGQAKPRIYARCRTVVPATWLKPDQQFLPRTADVESTVALALWRWDKIGEVATAKFDDPEEA